MRLRRLTAGEAALARDVFGAGLDFGRVRLVMDAPTGGWAIALFGLILFPRTVEDFATEPMHAQAWLVHELTHAWQFQTRPLWTLASWAGAAISGGYLTRRAYLYALPIDWNGMNLEQQAKAVEHRFLLTRGLRTKDMPEGADLAAYASLPF